MLEEGLDQIAPIGNVENTQTDELGRVIVRDGVAIDSAKHFFNDQTKEGLVVISEDEPNPGYVDWEGDIILFTNTETAEEFKKLASELSQQSPLPESPRKPQQ